MAELTRRSMLALGAGVAVSVAGCLADDGAGTTDRPSATPTDSLPPSSSGHLSFNHAAELHRTDSAYPQRDVGSYFLALLTSEDDTTAFPTALFENEAAAAFVTDTAYDEASVVVLQDRRSSSHPNLELLDVGRDGGSVTVEARYPGDAATSDITTDTLLVRIPNGEGSLESARATVRPQYGDPVRFSTWNAYDHVPAFDPAGDLVLRNRDCAGAPLSVLLTHRGDLFFQDRFDLSPASIRRVGGVLTHPGEWTVTVGFGSETTTWTWTLTDGTPGDVLVDVAGDGTLSLVHRPSGVVEGPPGACETNDYPYESSSPAENLADPVDLWVLDFSDGEHHLAVSIRDGDVDVFDDEFETRTGYDKARRAGLLAKKTTYTVAVQLDEGTTVTETVRVEDGTEKLVVRVSESGDLSISLD
jgi:hypothetical protein